MAGLCIAGPHNAPVDFLRHSVGARACLRALAYGVVAASLWVLGRTLGWEIAVPTWLGLGSAAAIANLYLTAAAHRAQLVAGGAAGLLALAGAATMAVARVPS